MTAPDIGLDDDDLAVIKDAENDHTKVVTKSPVKPYQLGYISVFCIIINKMIGNVTPLSHAESTLIPPQEPASSTPPQQ